MKFPPASANASNILRLSSFEAPHPHSSPKVMAPRQSSDTLRPLLPSSLNRMFPSSSTRKEFGRVTVSGTFRCFSPGLRLDPLLLQDLSLKADVHVPDGDLPLAPLQRLDRRRQQSATARNLHDHHRQGVDLRLLVPGPDLHLDG